MQNIRNVTGSKRRFKGFPPGKNRWCGLHRASRQSSSSSLFQNCMASDIFPILPSVSDGSTGY